MKLDGALQLRSGFGLNELLDLAFSAWPADEEDSGLRLGVRTESPKVHKADSRDASLK
jgi:hypothetical protein